MNTFCESTIEEELLKNASYAACAKGGSMEPMLRGGRDVVIIAPVPEKVKKYDVVLFRDAGARYVLHRVIRRKGNVYITRGDNTYFCETVPYDNLVGILVAYNKDGKRYEINAFRYKLYARCRVFFYPLRKLFHKVRIVLAGLYRKIFKRGGR